MKVTNIINLIPKHSIPRSNVFMTNVCGWILVVVQAVDAWGVFWPNSPSVCVVLALVQSQQQHGPERNNPHTFVPGESG